MQPSTADEGLSIANSAKQVLASIRERRKSSMIARCTPANHKLNEVNTRAGAATFLRDTTIIQRNGKI
jgi:hypothetical protein